MRRPSLFIIAVLALAGIVLAVLSLNEYSMNMIANQIGVEIQSSFCNINAEFNCTTVNQSGWATWLGVPVASYGLWFYILLLSFCLLFSDDSRFYDDEVSDTLAFLSFIGMVVSLVLFLISKLEIGVLCPTCLGTYVINILFFLTTIYQRSRRKGYVTSVRDGLFTLIGFVIEGTSFQNRNRSSMLKLFAMAAIMGALFSYSLKDLLALRYLASYTQAPTWQGEKEQVIKLDLSDGPDKDYSLGPADAPLRLVEFADFECPACQVLYLIISELMQKYDGKVNYVFKNYPLSKTCNAGMAEDLHVNACYAAALGRCAGEQGKFWEMADHLFRVNISDDSEDQKKAKDEMGKGIEKLGLDKEKIEKCIDSAEVNSKIRSDIQQGDELGIAGTPAIFINGKALNDTSYEGLNKVFTDILG